MRKWIDLDDLEYYIDRIRYVDIGVERVALKEDVDDLLNVTSYNDEEVLEYIEK